MKCAVWGGGGVGPGALVVCSILLLGTGSVAAQEPEESELETSFTPAPDAGEISGAPSGVPRRINDEDLGRLPAFSHATVVGELVFVSGTLGTLPRSVELVEGGVGPETTQTMENVAAILETAGSSLDHLASCTVYLVDMADFEAMNRAWLAAVGPSPPARATIGVAELALGAAVEIQCVATRGE